MVTVLASPGCDPDAKGPTAFHPSLDGRGRGRVNQALHMVTAASCRHPGPVTKPGSAETHPWRWSRADLAGNQVLSPSPPEMVTDGSELEAGAVTSSRPRTRMSTASSNRVDKKRASALYGSLYFFVVLIHCSYSGCPGHPPWCRGHPPWCRGHPPGCPGHPPLVDLSTIVDYSPGGDR
jgi:hypothetical protein